MFKAKPTPGLVWKKVLDKMKRIGVYLICFMERDLSGRYWREIVGQAPVECMLIPPDYLSANSDNGHEPVIDTLRFEPMSSGDYGFILQHLAFRDGEWFLNLPNYELSRPIDNGIIIRTSSLTQKSNGTK